MKRHRFGIKTWTLCDADTGYIYCFEIYTAMSKIHAEYSSYNTAERVVLSLVSQLQTQHNIVVMDNFYTSIRLFELLADGGYGACGTVRCNRSGMPEMATKANLNRLEPNQTFFARKNRTTLCVWRDKRPVLLLSTMHGTELCEKLIRDRHAELKFRVVNPPTAVQSYNFGMKGVDLADQKMGYYSVYPHASRKWPVRLFHHCLDQCLLNAYICYQSQCISPITRKEFHMEISRDLCKLWIYKTKVPQTIAIDVGTILYIRVLLSMNPIKVPFRISAVFVAVTV
jgi:hypothetical protein